jgi:hypothetical protein
MILASILKASWLALRRADEALPRRASEESRRELAPKGRFYEAHEFCELPLLIEGLYD